MVDMKCLSNSELQNRLDELGFSPGPILPSTRKTYEKKLMQLLVSPPCASPVMNGTRKLDRAQDYDDSKGTIRSYTRPKASRTKPKVQDIYCLDHKHSEKIRCASRAPNTRFKEWSNTTKKDYCVINKNVGSRKLERLPVGLKLAVFGIFIIVVFVYITVEKKPLFG
ncbi:LEM domain-containing protein 1 [Pteropus alecto]|uniref:LEM domain-containing protein 1 n=1 Tax=Pteropus alecto TaxID=9402 RepID=L5JV30_PTEAL|nr:LEM domain-containing protein 1 [Pteropus alecto]